MLSKQMAEQTALDDRTLKQRGRTPFVAIFDADGVLVAAQTTAHEFAAIATGAASAEDAALVRDLVRRTAVRWAAERRAHPERVLLKPALMVTLIPLAGPGGTLVGLTFDRFATREALARSIAAFGITRREAEVLRLMLDGLSSVLIGERLHISQATAQGHLKRLLVKTDSKNRAQMIARVLGWQGGES
jgi:DNA-binding CsgD family transcriptional regulator